MIATGAAATRRGESRRESLCENRRRRRRRRTTTKPRNFHGALYLYLHVRAADSATDPRGTSTTGRADRPTHRADDETGQEGHAGGDGRLLMLSVAIIAGRWKEVDEKAAGLVGHETHRSL